MGCDGASKWCGASLKRCGVAGVVVHMIYPTWKEAATSAAKEGSFLLSSGALSTASLTAVLSPAKEKSKLRLFLIGMGRGREEGSPSLASLSRAGPPPPPIGSSRSRATWCEEGV